MTQDNAVLSPIATKYIEKVAKKEITALITCLTVQEVIYILVYVYKVNKKEVVVALKKLIQLNNLKLTDLPKEALVKALEDYSKYNVDFPDCVFKQSAIYEKAELLSFDKDFKKLGVNTVNVYKH